MSEELLALRSITASRRGRRIVSGIDLTVRSGEIVAVVGPNGAGKSTMLAIASGDLEADAGQVEMTGRPLQDLSPTEAAQQRAVLVQQQPLDLPFAVRHVIAMGRNPWHRTARADDDLDVVAAVAREMELEHLLDRPLRSLSGGESARACIARTLAQQARLLLLDEPTAALDLGHEELVLAAVRRRVEDGAGAVLVVHDLNLAAAHADRVVVLADGALAADGPPVEILGSELLSRVYRHPIGVLTHPTYEIPLVIPDRAHLRGSSRP